MAALPSQLHFAGCHYHGITVALGETLPNPLDPTCSFCTCQVSRVTVHASILLSGQQRPGSPVPVTACGQLWAQDSLLDRGWGCAPQAQ